MDIQTADIVSEFNTLTRNLAFPLKNLNVINNGHCRMCQFYQKIVSASDIKKLRQHYKKHHKVKDIKNSDPQLRKIVQENNSLDPNTTCKTIGVFDSNKCIQLECRQIRVEKRKAELGTLTDPCIKILQDGKNKKFLHEQHLLEKDDFIKHPVFACDAHSCQHPSYFRQQRHMERLTINYLTLQYGVMYSFDLFLFTLNKLKLSNFHPRFRSEMSQRRNSLKALSSTAKMPSKVKVTPPIQDAVLSPALKVLSLTKKTATKVQLTPIQSVVLRQAASLRHVTEFLTSQNYNLENMTNSDDIKITWRTGDIEKTYHSSTKKITTMESEQTAIPYPPNKKLKL